MTATPSTAQRVPARSAFAQVVDQFGTDQVTPHAGELDAHPPDMVLIRSLLLAVGRLGLYASVVPTEYNGAGQDTLALHEGVDALAYHDAGLAMSTMPTYLVARALVGHGSAEQQARWLSRLCEGDALASWAVTEPDTGSDVASVATRARRMSDGWCITGRKMFITNAAIADVMLLLARTGGQDDRRQLSAFLIPLDRPGIAVSAPMDKMGLRSSPTCEIVLDDVRAADAELVGGVGAGWDIGMSMLNYERIAVPAIAAGICQRALDLSIDHAQRRTAFGGPIADLGVVRAMLADIASHLLECRLLYRHSAQLVDGGAPAVPECSIGKLVGARLATEAASLAVQVHGGYGYIREYPVERLYRDARLFAIGGGTSEVQREIIAGQLRRQRRWSTRAGLSCTMIPTPGHEQESA